MPIGMVYWVCGGSDDTSTINNKDNHLDTIGTFYDVFYGRVIRNKPMNIHDNIDELNEQFNMIESKYRILWDHLLDDDNGISDDAYVALINLGEQICPHYVCMAKNFVHSTNNRYYLPTSEETV